MTDEIQKCQDWDPIDPTPGCEEVADLKYTMSFESIGMPPIYWCEPCGQRAMEMDEVIKQAHEEDPSFEARFKKAIEEAQKQSKMRQN